MKQFILFASIILFFIPSCTNNQNENISEKENIAYITSDSLELTNIHFSKGKELFIYNCSPCHGENKYVITRSFQKIRDFYELDWLIGFIQNNDSLKKLNDVRIPNIFRQSATAMPVYRNMSADDIISILDYVDSFPIDSVEYNRRKLNLSETQDSLYYDF